MSPVRKVRRPSFQFSGSFKAWLFSPVILLFLVACRLLLVANYDSTTAMTIASTLGAVSTLLGTMIPILSAYLPAIALFFAVIRSWRTALLAVIAAVLVTPAQQTLPRTVDDVQEQWTTLYDGLFNEDGPAHLLDRTDLWWIGGYFIAWLVIGGILLRWPPAGYAWYFVAPEEEQEEETVSSWKKLGRRVRALVLCAAGMAAFVFVQHAYAMTFALGHLSDTARLPWMPPEHITIAEKNDDGGDEEKERTEIVYVLTVGEEWTVLLEEDTRTISYVPSPEVKERTVCELPATRTTSSPPLLPLQGAERSDLSDCDELAAEPTS